MSRPKIVLPFRGEFGILVRFHVPAVYALKRPVTVCHEPGLEALYPDCARVIVPRRPDKDRRWTMGHDAAFVDAWKKRLMDEHLGSDVVALERGGEWEEKRFVPEPWEAQRNGALAPHVIVCPRWRAYGEAKNWKGWGTLTRALAFQGVRIFAAGLRDTSDVKAVDGHEAAWDYDRPLDATIEAMRRAGVVIATDAGLAHLAVLCGAPLVLIGANGGRVAPGPSKDEHGKIQHPNYWHIQLDSYYRAANHKDSLIEMIPDGWNNIPAIMKVARRLLKQEAVA